MPPKTVKCEICGQEVSKRQTLSLQDLNGSSGRACRDHEELQNLLELKAKREETERTLTVANEAMFVLMAVAEIRVTSSLLGVPPAIHYMRFRQNKVPKHLIAKVQAKVEELGEKMSPVEMAVSLASGLSMRQRMRELDQKKAAQAAM
ncbi:hypothetical protein ACFL2U_00765 [Patescibacteria group bacterium]